MRKMNIPQSATASAWTAGWQSPRILVRKIRRLGRILAGNDALYRPEIQCAHVRLGDDGADFCVNPEKLSQESVVYSFGIGTNLSFDLGILRFVHEVHAFDPTPRSLAWVANQKLPAGLHVHPIGVSDFDGLASFEPPNDQNHVSYRGAAASTNATLKAPVNRLASIMQMLGHRSLDLLKIDIEGGEYAVLEDLLKSRIVAKQICVEFHHRWPDVGIKATASAIDRLRAAPYRIFDVSASGEEFSFIRI